MLILKMLLTDAAPNGDHGGGDPMQLNMVVLLIKHLFYTILQKLLSYQNREILSVAQNK